MRLCQAYEWYSNQLGQRYWGVQRKKRETRKKVGSPQVSQGQLVGDGRSWAPLFMILKEYSLN